MLRSKLDETDEIGDSWNSLLPKSNILPNKQTHIPNSVSSWVPRRRSLQLTGALGLVTYVWHPAHAFLQINFPFQASLSQHRSSSVFCRHSYQVKSVFCRYRELGDQQWDMVGKYLWIFCVLCLIWTVCQYPPLASASYSTFLFVS